MRLITTFILGVAFWFGATATAAAQCAGSDLFAALARDEPQRHAQILAKARAVPNGRGKFWRVERPGSPPSWLFGTFHDTGAGADALAPPVERALTGARLMLVELTDAEEAKMQTRMTTDPGFILSPDDNGVIAQLTEDERAAAAKRLAERGLNFEIAARLKPWMLFTSLALPACMIREAQAGKPILDDMLAQRAGAAGVPVQGLETYGEALGALIDLPQSDMVAMVLDLLRSPYDEQDVWRTSAGLYRAGEIAAIWEFSQAEAQKTIGARQSAAVFPRFERELLVDRNRAWMKSLVPEMEDGNVFAAFGALHLVGDAGIVELLRARGFTVTRLD
ncbi:MAG: TraB/GumN family protein [Paracoccaceae bacterium]|nr:TraB/GumN family protein [Paracoccaceae bacterium]